jgi:palmitoyl-protein thioesterase
MLCIHKMFEFLKTLLGLHLFFTSVCAKPVTTGTPLIFRFKPQIEYVDIDFPIVVLHGLASSREKMIPFSDWLELKFKRKVFNMEIGSGEKTSLFTPLNIQLSELCNSIYNITELKNGFDFIGISQGGLLARGYIEQCNAFPVRNLITLVSPHGGVFIRGDIIDMYSDFNQQHLSLSNYWRDPNRIDRYFKKCSFLPIINNEVIVPEKSRKRKENLCNLSNFVMIWSPNDGILYPPESGKFSFYDATLNIIPIEMTPLYRSDALGLRFLNENGRLFMYKTNCTHEDHRNPICFEQLYDILAKYI